MYKRNPRESNLLWPETLSIALDGYLYVAANQLHRQERYQKGQDLRRKPSTFSESILTHACNNWATNNASNTLTFTNERNQFLKFLDERNIKNIIFLTTDVHYAATVKVSQDFGDGDLFAFYEMTNCSLNVYTK